MDQASPARTHLTNLRGTPPPPHMLAQLRNISECVCVCVWFKQC